MTQPLDPDKPALFTGEIVAAADIPAALAGDVLGAGEEAPKPVFKQYMELPRGGSVSFGDPEDLTGADFQNVIDSIRSDDSTGIAKGFDAAFGVACALITAWEIPGKPGYILPKVDPRQLLKLKLPQYRAIMAHVAPAVSALFDDDDKDPDDAGRPGSPT